MFEENRYASLAHFGKELLNKTSIIDGLPYISAYAKKVIGAQRCSIFIYDLAKNELWTTISDGVGRIVVQSDRGIVGHTIKMKKPMTVNNPYENPYFLSDIDRETGYKTKNLITAPIFNANREVIGVFELLNKEEDFDEKDIKFMVFFAHFISGFLELVNLYEHEKSRDN